MKFDLAGAKAFLAEWDAIQEDGSLPNRGKIAEQKGINRSHAYEVAERCRKIVREGSSKKKKAPSL